MGKGDQEPLIWSSDQQLEELTKQQRSERVDEDSDQGRDINSIADVVERWREIGERDEQNVAEQRDPLNEETAGEAKEGEQEMSKEDEEDNHKSQTEHLIDFAHEGSEEITHSPPCSASP